MKGGGPMGGCHRLVDQKWEYKEEKEAGVIARFGAEEKGVIMMR